MKIEHGDLERLRRLNRSVILQRAQGLDPIAFEHLVGAIFERRGYTVSTTVTSGDEGVDLLVRQGRRLAVVQCKRYKGNVGSPLIRDLYGTMLHNGADEAYMVTTGSISNQARNWCQGKPIHLIDGIALVEWISGQSRDRRTGRRLAISGLVALVAVALLVGVYAGVGAPGLPPQLAAAWQGWQVGQGESTPTLSAPTLSTVATPIPPVTASATVQPSPTPVSTPSPPPSLAAPLVNLAGELDLFLTTAQPFAAPQSGLTLRYPAGWNPQEESGDGGGDGSGEQRIVVTGPGNYGLEIVSQPTPFADLACGLAQTSDQTYQSIPVQNMVLWRPSLFAQRPPPLELALVVPQSADGSRLGCGLEVNGRWYRLRYLFPAPSSEGGEQTVDAGRLRQMDLMVTSLTWE